MLQEEFSRLIYMYQEAAEGKGTSVQDIFQKSLDFIQLLKKEVAEGSEEDRQAAVRMMNELYQHMKNHTKTMCDRAGISEEEFIANAENPANFTPEQWRAMQVSRENLAHAGQDLVKLLREKREAAGEVAPGSELMPPKATPEKKSSKIKKPKKSDWMRS